MNLNDIRDRNISKLPALEKLGFLYLADTFLNLNNPYDSPVQSPIYSSSFTSVS